MHTFLIVTLHDEPGRMRVVNDWPDLELVGSRPDMFVAWLWHGVAETDVARLQVALGSDFLGSVVLN